MNEDLALDQPATPYRYMYSAGAEAAKWREINKRMYEGRVSPKSVQHVVAAYYKVGFSDLIGQGRAEYIRHPRHTAIYLMRTLCVVKGCGAWKPISYQAIAAYFNRPRHTYATHAKSAVLRRMEVNAEYKRDVNNIISLLGR